MLHVGIRERYFHARVGNKSAQSNPLPFARKHRILVGRSICTPISQPNVIISKYRRSGAYCRRIQTVDNLLIMRLKKS